jgi:xylitol oxidase
VSHEPGALTNWAGTHRFGANRLHAPGSVDEAAEIIGGASRIRVLGSRHSFNDIADSAELISLRGLPEELEIDTAASTVRVASGLSYGVVAARLNGAGLGLHNLGSLPHITVGGACATGTHGSGDRNGVLASAVRGLDLIAADGTMRSVRPGDPRFDGSVIALGALGAVTHLELQVEPAYQVQQSVFEHLPWRVLLDSFDEVTSLAYSVSVLGFWGRPTLDYLWLKRRLDREEPIPLRMLSLDRSPVDSAISRDSVNGNISTLDEVGPWSERMAHFRADRAPSNSGDEIQSEYFVDRADAPDALRAVRELADVIDQMLVMSEIRTMAADELWLSPAYRRDSVGIHFTWLGSAGAEVHALLPRIEEALRPFGARPHWGKAFRMSHDHVRAVTPRLDDFLALRRERDPRDVFRNHYLDRVLLGTSANR